MALGTVNSGGGVGMEFPITVTTAGTGAAYTAQIPGLAVLSTGLTLTIIPHTVSTSTAPTLNINGLGAKTIKQSTSAATGTLSAPANANFLTANKPIMLQYDGSYWKTITPRATASDLSGTLAISKGGTGATTAAAARTSLGALNKAGDTMTGTLTLSGAPTADLHAATKKYVDDQGKAAPGIPIVSAVSTDQGKSYTATVPGVTTLTVGMMVTIIPDRSNSYANPTLNINNLGAKTIYRFGRIVNSPSGLEASGFSGGWPVTVMYTGNSWFLVQMGKPIAGDLQGTVSIANGGTGASTAANARTNLGALAKSGDTMTGALTLSGAPTANLHAATKKYVDDNSASVSDYTATLTTTWTGSGPWTQTVTVSGVLSTDAPIIDVSLSGTSETDTAILKDWANVSRITTAANSITATCYDKMPTVAIPIKLKVVR